MRGRGIKAKEEQSCSFCSAAQVRASAASTPPWLIAALSLWLRCFVCFYWYLVFSSAVRSPLSRLKFSLPFYFLQRSISSIRCKFADSGIIFLKQGESSTCFVSVCIRESWLLGLCGEDLSSHLLTCRNSKTSQAVFERDTNQIFQQQPERINSDLFSCPKL